MTVNKEKQDMINRVIAMMKTEGVSIAENEDISDKTKAAQMDVVLDVVRFLRGYEKNVEILSEYNYEHRFDRYKEDEGREIDD